MCHFDNKPPLTVHTSKNGKGLSETVQTKTTGQGPHCHYVSLKKSITPHVKIEKTKILSVKTTDPSS